MCNIYVQLDVTQQRNPKKSFSKEKEAASGEIHTSQHTYIEQSQLVCHVSRMYTLLVHCWVVGLTLASSMMAICLLSVFTNVIAAVKEHHHTA